ncbi:TRL domain-containing protein [Halobacteriovorax sp. GB3]|uniref:TRL domain-containing protein n=1 Tax=Halobacteriovorax sp. GB3 TaxID=2719615 RepID=UPI00235EA7AF|nr:TRL domain-containing protein [Halobacteriovorax sp. GB3]MDD0852656.1 TRL domain-containing protein [Halobacteriovorax sp. GB3]
MTYLKLIILSLLLSSCALYNPVQVTSNKLGNVRTKACTDYVLGFHAGGDNLISSAAKNAQIETISTVDTSIEGFFPFSFKRCVYITGQSSKDFQAFTELSPVQDKESVVKPIKTQSPSPKDTKQTYRQKVIKAHEYCKPYNGSEYDQCIDEFVGQ